MHGLNWSSPFESISSPWILGFHFLSFPYAVEEIENEKQLCRKYNYRCDRDKFIETIEVSECLKCVEPVVPSWYTRHTHVMHGPEYGISANHRQPEMYPSHRFIHKPSIHAWKPMIHSGKHAEESCDTHYNMEVGYYKICIMHLDVNGRVAQEYTCESTGDKHRNKSDRKKHS